MSNKTIALSGGADPAHPGHLRMINEAAKYGDVVWILNSDEWLKRKKGYVFMTWDERAEILRGFENVKKVIRVIDDDGSVCEALRFLKPDYFGNGGDRTDKNTPEKQLCEDIGIEMVWGLGGGKIQSSSELVQNAMDQLKGKTK